MLLAIESSAKTASVGVVRDGVVLAEAFQNNGLTHSKTVLPMVEEILKTSGCTLPDLDAIAVAAGPGSFTGLRIGVAAAKGLALAAEKPCIGVSTLAATAYNVADGFVCVAMDARAGQVYTALFRMHAGVQERVSEDAALPLELLEEPILAEKSVILLGDGAKLCYTKYEKKHPGLILAPEWLRYPRASGVAAAAAGLQPTDPAELTVRYLRLPQAERERLLRKAK